MPRCAATKRDGGRCTAIVKPPQTHCYQHDELRKEERRRAASKAGRSRPNREIIEIRSILCELTEQVIAGDIATAPAAVAGQLLNTRLRAVEIGRRLQEQQNLLDRLETLEAQAERVSRVSI